MDNSVQCLLAQSCPTLCCPMHCSPPGSSVHGDSPGKNIGVGCCALLHGIFPTQGSNPGLPHCTLPPEPPDEPKNTGVGSLSLLQGIFLTQELNQGLLHCRWILYQLSRGNSASKSNSFSFHPPPQIILLLCMDTQDTVTPSSQQHV